MVDSTPWKACLLTVAVLFAALPGAAADGPENPDDGSAPSSDDEPCRIVNVGTQEPYVDPHPECIGP